MQRTSPFAVAVVVVVAALGAGAPLLGCGKARPTAERAAVDPAAAPAGTTKAQSADDIIAGLRAKAASAAHENAESGATAAALHTPAPPTAAPAQVVEKRDLEKDNYVRPPLPLDAEARAGAPKPALVEKMKRGEIAPD